PAGIPFGPCGVRDRERVARVGGGRPADAADDSPPVRGVALLDDSAGSALAIDDRARFPCARRGLPQRRRETLELEAVGEIPAARVRALAAEDFRWQRN